MANISDKERAKKVLNLLKKEHKNPVIALNFKTPLDLAIATLLSAQCTDERVNIVTLELFKKYKKAKDYAQVKESDLKEDIKSINFFNNKAVAIQKACTIIEEEHKGTLPDNLKDLVNLPGIGRKTANVILAQAFGKDALAVDTHVKRVATRLGFTTNTNPDKIEADLCSLIDKKNWSITTSLFILHGRQVCKARKPLCQSSKDACKIIDQCTAYKKGEF